MNYFQFIVRVAHWGATVAALIVAAGATIGFHDMTGSWPIALLGGIGIASILALGWYILISMGSRVRRTSAKALTITLGVFLVVAALGTSGWALATAIGGKQALANYQTRALTEHELALADAMSRVNGQLELVDSVSQTAAATRLLAAEEGRSGEGPLYRSYMRTQENLEGAAELMNVKILEGQDLYQRGIIALDVANQNLGNAEDFRLAIGEVQKVITLLNGIDVSGDITSIGMVGLNDRGLPELSTLTANLQSIAADADTKLVDVPRFVPATRSEATMSERPLGAWIAAIAIDTAPLILLLLVMVAVNEPLLREARKTKHRTSDDEIRAQEDIVEGNVTALQRRMPAE